MSQWFQRPTPSLLYHGTLYKNYESIRRHGIRAGSREKANFDDFQDDIRGMVSLSDTELAARRFAVYSLVGLHAPEGHGRENSDFVVFAVSTPMLLQSSVQIIPLRGHLSADYGGHEYRVIGSIPASAIVAAFRYHYVGARFTRERIF